MRCFRQLAARRRALAWLVAAVGCGLAAGCGTSEYNSRVNQYLDDLRNKPQLAPTPITITRGGDPAAATLRLPRFMSTAEDLARLGGPPLTPPGYRAGYLIPCPTADGAVVNGFMLAAVMPAEAVSAGDLTKQLTTFMKFVAPNMPDQWEAAQLPSPQGAPLPCLRARFSGMVPTSNPPAQGNFALYLHSSPKIHVLVAWVIPANATADLNAPLNTEASVGSLVVQEVAAPPPFAPAATDTPTTNPMTTTTPMP